MMHAHAPARQHARTLLAFPALIEIDANLAVDLVQPIGRESVTSFVKTRPCMRMAAEKQNVLHCTRLSSSGTSVARRAFGAGARARMLQGRARLLFGVWLSRPIPSISLAIYLHPTLYLASMFHRRRRHSVRSRTPASIYFAMHVRCA